VKIPGMTSKRGPKGVEALSGSLKVWLAGSVVVLLLSLLLFVGTVVAGFLYFNDATTPIWVTVFGTLSVLGIAAAFGGFFLTMALGVVQARKADKARAAAAQQKLTE
jgi:protein-S-isoprenylcysteine O-methyltransferase Ste14